MYMLILTSHNSHPRSDSLVEALLPLLKKPHFKSMDEWIKSVSNVARYVVGLYASSTNLLIVFSQSNPLLDMAPELFQLIVDNLTDDIDVICLALSCKSLWIALQPLVRNWMTFAHAPWVGERIWVHIKYWHYPEEVHDDVEEFYNNDKNENLAYWTADWPDRAEDLTFPSRERLRERLNPTRKVLDKPCDLPKLRSATLFPPTESWILCNLSKQQFVRLDGAQDHKPFRRGLEEVLINKRPWTALGEGVLSKSMRGEWACDRLEVTVMDDSHKQWMDVSDDFAVIDKRNRKEEKRRRWRELMS